MAKTRADFADFNNPDTIIGRGVKVDGTLQTEGDIQINGDFKGKLLTKKDVVVGEHAVVDADINGENVYVAGEVKGDINAFGKIEILETGKVDGNVASSSLSIESGGILKGTSTMHEVEAERPETEPTYEVQETKSEETDEQGTSAA
ncbi:MAG: polymer-forming cytoskeletal protein [Patescibacteria group bacterium]|jgi:cytoskeletal protein CcmA (bactofilin family)